jgi:hypothetical protein
MAKRKNKKRIKIKGPIPSQILCLPNADKKFHETWHEGRGILDIPHPFRCCVLGRVGLGKSTIAKNILIHCQLGADPFEQLIIIHGSPESKEWDDCEPTMILCDIPPPEDLTSNTVKTLIIIDDFEFKGLSKESLKNLSSLFRFVSSHHNYSIICAYQSFFDVKPIVRKCCNVFIVYRPNDNDELGTIARRVGMKKHEMVDIFDELLTGKRDTLMIDMTEGSPAPLRKNLFQLIKEDDTI